MAISEKSAVVVVEEKRQRIGIAGHIRVSGEAVVIEVGNCHARAVRAVGLQNVASVFGELAREEITSINYD